jgi:hypothetical protein
MPQHETTAMHDRLVVYEIWRPHEGKVFCVFSCVVANISEEFVMPIFEVKGVNRPVFFESSHVAAHKDQERRTAVNTA